MKFFSGLRVTVSAYLIVLSVAFLSSELISAVVLLCANGASSAKGTIDQQHAVGQISQAILSLFFFLCWVQLAENEELDRLEYFMEQCFFFFFWISQMTLPR